MADVAYSGPNYSLPTVWQDRSGVRQKPFVSPKELPYTVWRFDASERIAWGGATEPLAGALIRGSRVGEIMNATRLEWGSSSIPNWANVMYSRLYNKLLSKAGERASLLTALAEYQSTSAMVGNRLLQLVRGAKALRKGRFREFLKLFGVSAKPKHKNTRWTRPRDFSSLWLEYWFGWAPTIGDIGNAIDVLQGEIPDSKVRVAAGNRSFDLSSSGSDAWGGGYNHSVAGSFVMQLRASVKVTNHNLWLANSLGFLNPVRTAWELVPFSWFADWFTNLGQVLGSFTDTVGIKISDVWMTRFATGRSDERYWDSPGRGFGLKRTFFGMNRARLGVLPRPELILRVPNLSWTRGATLSSLLVQLFSPKPK